MNYKICLYAAFLFLCIYVLSGVNFNVIMKKDSYIEARLLIMIISCSLSYLLTNFVLDFIGIS